MLKRACLAAAVMMAGTQALADQCYVLEKESAETAAKLIEAGDTVYQFCEPCGDEAPAAIVVESVQVSELDFGETPYYGVEVNGEVRDIAYLYVAEAGDAYKNLASLAQCPASSVSETITIGK